MLSADFAHGGLSRQRNFVQASRAMDDESVLDAEFGEHERDFFHHFIGKNADNLRARPGGIRQRAKQIERRAPQAPPRGHGVPHGRVHGRSKQKSDSDFANRRADSFRRNVQRNPQRFQHIRRAALR